MRFMHYFFLFPVVLWFTPGHISSPNENAIVSWGNTQPIRRVLQKARRGEGITIAAIGGSITEGFLANPRSLAWFPVMIGDIQERFPNAPVIAVNAFLRGTGSDLGAQRLRHDVLAYDPDILIVEFAVNDLRRRATRTDVLTNMDSIVRQCQAGPTRPAVLFLFTCHSDGTSAEDWQQIIGRRYRLPMISMREGIMPEIRAGRLAASDIWADGIHPNNLGHAFLAGFLAYYFQGISPCCDWPRSWFTLTAPLGSRSPAPVL